MKPFRKRLACAAVSATLLSIAASAQALDLLGAWRLATSNDPALLISLADVAAAEAARYQAVGGFLPSISINSTRYHADTVSTYTSLLGPRQSDSSYAAKNDSVNIRQPLLHVERIAQYKQAQAQEAGAIAAHENERQNLAQRLTSAYLDLLSALDNKTLVAAQKAAHAGQLSLTERAFQSGTGTRTDVDEARARYDMIVAVQIDAENQVSNAARSLQAITGERVSVPDLRPLRDGINLNLLTEAPSDQWLESALVANPELQAAEQQLAVAQLEVQKLRANHLPTIDLFAAHQRSESDTVTSIGQKYDTTQVGVQISIPLFSGGQVVAGTDQALARVERARQVLEATRRKLMVNIGKAFDGVSQGRQKIAAIETAVASAARSVLSTQKGVLAGTRNNVDVLNAQQQEAATRRDLARARYEYLINQLTLKLQAAEPADEVITRLNEFFGVTS